MLGIKEVTGNQSCIYEINMYLAGLSEFGATQQAVAFLVINVFICLFVPLNIILMVFFLMQGVSCQWVVQ